MINGDRYRIRLPEGFVLESHAVEIADQPDGQTLAAFLRVLGLTTLSGEVEKLFRSSLRLDVTLLRIQHEIPHPGGLQERMRDLAILAVFSALKARYLPGVKDCDALAFFHHLAAAVDQTNSTDEVLKVLTRSPAPWILQILSSIRDHARGLLPLSAVPEAFGLCEKIGDLEAPRRRPASPAQGEPSVLALLRLKPQEFAERPWRKYRVSERLRSELEAFRSFTAQKLDLEGLESRISEEGEDEDEEMKEDLKPGQTVAGMYRRYVARQRDSSGTGSRINGWTDRLMKDLKAAGVEGIANGYWIYGGDRPDDRFHGRIYISLRRREAVAIWKYLEQTFAADLKQRGVSIQFKMAVQREGLLRSDSGVVYFFAKDQREIYDAIVRMHGEHPEFFKGGRPIFTAPLVDASGREMNGISFGEHPYSRGESFGGLRAFALGQGIQLARLLLSTGLALDWEGLLQIFAFCLDRCGVDQQQPAFNQGGERNFLFLKGKMKA